MRVLFSLHLFLFIYSIHFIFNSDDSLKILANAGNECHNFIFPSSFLSR